jgi:AhpD family alkylhydroperoxidase
MKETEMKSLDGRDRELVALGAALAANCVPCIEYHIPQASRAGLSEPEIKEAIALADKVRQVPAAKVLKTAMTMLGQAGDGEPSPSERKNELAGQCCG